MLKPYLRVDYNYDDALLEGLVEFSQDYVENATGYREDLATSTNLHYKLALAMTINHFYDNRESFVTSGAVPKAVPMTVQSMYSQLQRKQDVIDNAQA